VNGQRKKMEIILRSTPRRWSRANRMHKDKGKGTSGARRFNWGEREALIRIREQFETISGRKIRHLSQSTKKKERPCAGLSRIKHEKEGK